MVKSRIVKSKGGTGELKRVARGRIVAPKQARSIRTKEKILKAATKVFSEKGLHGSRIEDITRACGTNRQRVYAYFGSKRQLYVEVLVESYSQIAFAESMRSLGEDDIGNLSKVLVEVFIEYHRSHPEFWRLLAWENLYGGKHLASAQWSRLRGGYIDHIRGLYELGQNCGVFRREVGFHAYIFTIFSITYFYFSNRLTLSNLLGVDFDDSAMRRKTQDGLIALVRKGVEAGMGG